MSDASEVLSEILSEFAFEENSLLEKLEKLRLKRSELAENYRPYIPLEFETAEDTSRTKENALRRNKELRKELHISLSKLRSKRCYNPAEDNLNKMIDKYSEILSREDVD